MIAKHNGLKYQISYHWSSGDEHLPRRGTQGKILDDMEVDHVVTWLKDLTVTNELLQARAKAILDKDVPWTQSVITRTVDRLPRKNTASFCLESTIQIRRCLKRADGKIAFVEQLGSLLRTHDRTCRSATAVAVKEKWWVQVWNLEQQRTTETKPHRLGRRWSAYWGKLLHDKWKDFKDQCQSLLDRRGIQSYELREKQCRIRDLLTRS